MNTVFLSEKPADVKAFLTKEDFRIDQLLIIIGQSDKTLQSVSLNDNPLNSLVSNPLKSNFK